VIPLSASAKTTARKKKRIFTIAYLSYAAFYLARLNLSVALPAMSSELGHPKFFWGLMGGAFTIVYGFGQFANGHLVERYGVRKMLTIGLILSAAANALFGSTELAAVMMLLWAVNGYAQSTGWPSVVKLVGGMFGKKSMGKAGRAFSTCFLVGSIITLSASGYIVANFGWRAAFILPSLILIAFAFLFNMVVGKGVPEKIGHNSTPDRIFRRLVLLKRMMIIALAHVMLQFVRNGLSLWAPSMIFDVYRVPLEYASYCAAIVPLGGIVGSVASGWISDRYSSSRRMPVMLIMTAGLGIVLPMLYMSLGFGLMVNALLLFLSGLTLYGPYNMMATTVPMDLDDSYGTGRVAGFINGVGYFGAAFADPLTGWIIDSSGWAGAIAFWTASALLASVLMLVLLSGEHRDGILNGIYRQSPD